MYSYNRVDLQQPMENLTQITIHAEVETEIAEGRKEMRIRVQRKSRSLATIVLPPNLLSSHIHATTTAATTTLRPHYHHYPTPTATLLLELVPRLLFIL